ncbi:helix-turn-helix domain-containing protein [Streptomyces harbinensis]|uniref:helix-turn-helix domain-containing protein n=1 Tax=Streptomyces harbinensis TaxID=1176198 RepID=UPI0036798028
MERDWAHLGRELAAARGRRTQEEVARELGVGRTTIQKIEAGTTYTKPQPTHYAYAQLAGWTRASVDTVLGGGQPHLESAGTSDAAEESESELSTPDASGLSLRVIQALKEGPLLDSKVIKVPTAAGEVQATIVVRGQSDMSPEDLLAALREWQAREQPLHGEADGPSDS